MKKFFAVLILFFIFSCAKIDTRFLSKAPKEIYGNKDALTTIKIGNGGAGPTGILRALSQDYLEFSGNDYAILWYQDISVNTLQQLKNGVIDIALVYEKSQGDQAQKEGWATNYTVIFNDHFLIVGPKSNPAQLAQTDAPQDAFAKIADLGKKGRVKVFLSRDDNSGTNVKEQSIWTKLGKKPWQDNSRWYFKHHVFPNDALIYSNNNSLYTMTDFGTWLSNNLILRNLKIYLRGGDELLNPCFALLGKKPSPQVLEFLEYLKSDRAQNLIANFGKDKFGGRALFTPAMQQDF